MSKILEATCVAGLVKIDGLPITDATVLSQGTKASTGAALLDEDKCTYVASNATDIADLITKLSDLVQLVSDTFSSIGAGMTGPTTAPPPTLPAAIVQLALIKTQLTAQGSNLK